MRDTPRAGTVTFATSTSIVGSPTRATFLVTRTPASRSLLLATITAYCVLAASEIPDSLSRSTDQKSQPTFDGLPAAASHGVWHAPSLHTRSPSHVEVWVPPVPSSLHSHTSSVPTQYDVLGTHTVQPRLGSQTWPTSH